MRTAFSRRFGGWLVGLYGDEEVWKKRGEKLSACDPLRVYKQRLDVELAEGQPVYLGDQSGIYLVAGDFCDQRGCQTCAAVRGTGLVAKYRPRVLTEVLRDESRQTMPQHLVLTIRTGPDCTLADCYDRLKKGWAKFIDRRRKNASRMRPDISLLFQGGVGQIEAKRSEDNPEWWHVHLHLIVLTPPWIDYDKVRAMWAECLGQDVANLRFIKLHAWNDFEAGHVAPADFANAIGGGLREVLKYPFKGSELSMPDCKQWWEVIGRSRIVRSFGSLYGATEEIELDDGGRIWSQEQHVQACVEFVEETSSHVGIDERVLEPGEHLHYYDLGKGKRLWVETR